ncbi:PREDICTED: golgin subfamily A member 6-like protein 2 [Cercocebus atys]|uniref:golgin subfamily A member 6-like protein 2 n=1 Tax=Cercocebus atys TaxID=9531 RepID=UPI0005F52B38|nr:PREDICTED: golgin subfamily A member 6-like protein 2 [Cercocebus atys]
MMSEENRERKLAEAKKKFRGYHQWNNAGVGTGGTDTKKKINNGTNPETTTSGGCHSPEDEKAASHQHQEALRRELETQDHTIRILTSQKTELETGLYYSQEAARKCEGESKDLAGRLHRSWHFAAESQQALSAASTQHKKADRVSPTTCSAPWEPRFTDGGMSLKVPSAQCSVLPRRQHGPFSTAFGCGYSRQVGAESAAVG